MHLMTLLWTEHENEQQGYALNGRMYIFVVQQYSNKARQPQNDKRKI